MGSAPKRDPLHASEDEDRPLGRMDFVLSPLDENGHQRVIMQPDPRRYEIFEKDGQRFWLDRFLRDVIPEEVVRRALAEQSKQLPMFRGQPSIRSAPDYAVSRRKAVATEIETGSFVPPAEKPTANSTLNADVLSRGVAFLSVDICSSTAKRQRNKKSFQTAYRILLNELGTAVGHFSGSLLKTTGDGFIAYVDHPGFTTRCDLAIEVGLTMLRLMNDCINPELRKAGLEPLQIRVGADHGPAEVMHVNIIPTGFAAPEIASDALNRAVKIEQTCGENEFRIGWRLYRLIHVQWLERATALPFDGEAVGIPGYQIYRMA